MPTELVSYREKVAVCLGYAMLFGSVAFFAGMSELIIHRSRREAKKIQEKSYGNSDKVRFLF